MVFILAIISSTGAAAKASGVGKAANKPGVALFTDTSVACALKITAINNSKGFLCFNSHSAFGNISYIISIASIVFSFDSMAHLLFIHCLLDLTNCVM